MVLLSNNASRSFEWLNGKGGEDRPQPGRADCALETRREERTPLEKEPAAASGPPRSRSRRAAFKIRMGSLDRKTTQELESTVVVRSLLLASVALLAPMNVVSAQDLDAIKRIGILKTLAQVRRSA